MLRRDGMKEDYAGWREGAFTVFALLPISFHSVLILMFSTASCGVLIEQMCPKKGCRL